MTKQIHFSNQHKETYKEGFNSSNKYQQQKDKEYQELEDELTALDKENEGQSDLVNEEDTKETKEDNTDWKKRYSDLRSHTSKKEQEAKDRLAALEAQVEEAKKTASLPEKVSEEQFAEWVETYPTVAANMEKIVRNNLKDVEEKINKAQAKLTQNDINIQKQQALQGLLKKHPDWMELHKTPEWNEWLGSRPIVFQNLIHKPNSYDEEAVTAASEVISAYKASIGQTSTKKSKPSDAANTVSTSRTVNPGNGKTTFSESQILAMSEKEYASKEEAILEAQRKGGDSFVYDLSGAAR